MSELERENSKQLELMINSTIKSNFMRSKVEHEDEMSQSASNFSSRYSETSNLPMESVASKSSRYLKFGGNLNPEGDISLK